MPPRQEELFENDISVSQSPAIAVCDPYSTGCLVVKEMEKRGYSPIAIWSKNCNDELKAHVPEACGTMNYIAEVHEGGALEETADRLKRACGGRPLEALIPGGESGVPLADALSEFLGLSSNGTDIPNRRDKKVQQDLIRNRGLRAIREACGSKFSEVEEFLKTETYPLVLKPLDSAGSDGVKVVNNFDEAKGHFETLMSNTVITGGHCQAVLCQEKLEGNEYVVDQVSCNGHHKVMMIWKYDKRKANGGDYVYFGATPVEIDSKEAQALIPYMSGVLDALGIKYGATHSEVILMEGSDPPSPCLVEVNCRTNGGDGNWQPLAQALTGGSIDNGYSQIEATVDAYLNEANFNRLPDVPPSPFKASGSEVMLVSYTSGTIKAMPGIEEMKKMDTFVQLETPVRVGSRVEKTVDLITGLGSVILMSNDNGAYQRDLNRVRELESTNQLVDVE